MVQVILALLAVGVTIYALIDCLRRSDDEVQYLPRQVWCLITLVPLLGGIVWLLLGRGRIEGSSRRSARVIAPDDDVDFLRTLDRGSRERRRRAAEDARRKRRQEEARRREEVLREEALRREKSDGGPAGSGNGSHPNGDDPA